MSTPPLIDVRAPCIWIFLSSLQPEFFSNLLLVSLRRGGLTIVLRKWRDELDSGKETARRCCERQKLAVARNVIMSRHAHQPTRLYG
jgi:hypothetical protein